MSYTFEYTKTELIEIWKNATEVFLNFIENLQEENYLESFEYKNIIAESFESKRYKVFAHVFNHSTFHRGQIVNFLLAVGYTHVSSTDMISYFREKALIY